MTSGGTSRSGSASRSSTWERAGGVSTVSNRTVASRPRTWTTQPRPSVACSMSRPGRAFSCRQRAALRRVLGGQVERFGLGGLVGPGERQLGVRGQVVERDPEQAHRVGEAGRERCLVGRGAQLGRLRRGLGERDRARERGEVREPDLGDDGPRAAAVRGQPPQRLVRHRVDRRGDRVAAEDVGGERPLGAHRLALGAGGRPAAGRCRGPAGRGWCRTTPRRSWSARPGAGVAGRRPSGRRAVRAQRRSPVRCPAPRARAAAAGRRPRRPGRPAAGRRAWRPPRRAWRRAWSGRSRRRRPARSARGSARGRPRRAVGRVVGERTLLEVDERLVDAQLLDQRRQRARARP